MPLKYNTILPFAIIYHLKIVELQKLQFLEGGIGKAGSSQRFEGRTYFLGA